MENLSFLQKLQKSSQNKDSISFENTEENLETIKYFVNKNIELFNFEIVDESIIVKKINNG